MNWKQLKDFCNNLPESELEKKVIIWRENEAIKDINAEQLEEDYVINIEEADSGCFPLSEAENQIKNDKLGDFPNGLEHFKKVHNKGTAILFEII